MPTFVSMLRGVNVGGQRTVRMEDLRAAYEALGFRNVRTYVQSGNVVFDSPKAEASGVAREAEGAIKKRFGFDAVVLVRTEEELREIAVRTPFSGEDETKMYVTFLRDRPRPVAAGAMDAFVRKGEKYVVNGREVYLFLLHGYGRTKLSNSFFEGKLRTSATTRNWRTVKALLEMTQG